MSKLKEDILKLRNQGKSYKQIKNELNCSMGNISFHCSKIDSNEKIIIGLRKKQAVKQIKNIDRQGNLRSSDELERIKNGKKPLCELCKKECRTQHNIFCSKKCRSMSPRLREENKQRMLEKVKNGTHSGWTSRKNKAPSYPEKYFMSVFDNEKINYEREVKVGKYFIDFVLDGKLAVEIDGKQHKLTDRIIKDKEKTAFLEKEGWTVMRIEWKNPSKTENKTFIEEKVKEIKKLI